MCGRRLDARRQGLPRGRRRAPRRDPGGRGGHRPAQLHRAADDHRLARAERPGHRQVHGSALGAEEVAATKTILGFDPEQTFEVPAAFSSTPARRWPAGRPLRPTGTSSSARGRPSRPRTWRSTSGCDPLPARRLGRRAAVLRRRREGGRDPCGLRKGDHRPRPRPARAVGRLPDLAGSNNTTTTACRRSCRRTARRDFQGDPYAGRVLHFGIREHAMGSIMNGIALHGGTRFRAPSWSSPTTCVRRSGSRR